MKLCLFDENCGEDTKSSRIDRKSDVTCKPETGIPHDLQRIHRHHGIFRQQRSCSVRRCRG